MPVSFSAYFLCAEWCGVCRSFADSVKALEIPDVDIYWVDIEEESAWDEEQDIEGFPTLVVKLRGCTVFFGMIEPDVDHLRRLLLSLDHLKCGSS